MKPPSPEAEVLVLAEAARGLVRAGIRR
jgi:hypothetical protein